MLTLRMVDAYISFYIPIHFDSIGSSVADISRAMLLFTFMLGYIGPPLSSFIISKDTTALKGVLLCNFLIILALCFSGIFIEHTIAAYVAAGILGIASGFGASVHNLYFCNMHFMQKIGSVKAVAWYSVIDRGFNVLGPIIFAAFIVMGHGTGLIAMGAVFFAALLLYMISLKIL